MYGATHDARLGQPGKDAFAAMKMIRTVNQQQYTPAHGAQYGQGVATCRTPNGWSAPVFVRLEGGSFGWQIGVGFSTYIMTTGA